MLRRLALAAALALAPVAAHAQFATIGPTPAVSDNGDRLATTAWVNNFFALGIPLSSGKIFVGSAGNIATQQTMSGDCNLSITAVIICTQAAGNFTVVGNLSVGGAIIDANGILATNIVAPATPAAGTTRIYVDSTTKVLTFKNDAGTVGNAVVPLTCAANQFGISVSAAGVVGCAQPAITNLSGLGTGIATALGVNVGSAGAPVLFNGAGGTPTSLVLTNGTGLPTTALTGTLQAAQEPAHTGDVTNSAGALAMTLATVNANTGSWGTATQTPQFTVNGKGLITAAANVTVTPAIASITGLGTGVATALAVNVGSAGAPVVFNGAGGTPSAITLTNGSALPTTALTGALQAAQEPAHTGDCENAAASLTLTCKRANLAARGGAFDIWQRLVGTGGATTIAQAASTTAYTNDGWYLLTGANEAATITQSAGIATGSVFAAKVQRNSGQTGTTVMRYAMPLDTDELVPLQSQFVTLSFTMKDGANQSFSHSVTATLYCGTGAVAKRGSSAYTGETSVISSGVTTSASATRFQATSAAIVPANCTQMEIQFSWTPSGTAGADDSFTVDDLQLEAVLASTSTASSFIKSPAARQIAEAQRHLWVPTAGSVANGVYGIGMVYSAVLGVVVLPLPVPMRAVPALGTGTSAASAFQFVANGATFTGSVIALQTTSTTNAVEIDFTIAGATGGNAAWLRSSGATSQMILSAEI